MGEELIPNQGQSAVELIIRIVPGQGLQLQGPIEDKILCLGLMELAKVAIIQHNPEQRKPGVVIPMTGGVGNPAEFLRKLRNKS